MFKLKTELLVSCLCFPFPLFADPLCTLSLCVLPLSFPPPLFAEIIPNP